MKRNSRSTNELLAGRYVYFTGKDLKGIIDLTPRKRYQLIPHPVPDNLAYIIDDEDFRITLYLAKGYRCPHLNCRYVWQLAHPSEMRSYDAVNNTNG